MANDRTNTELGVKDYKVQAKRFESESPSLPALGRQATGSRFRTPRSAPISPDHGSSESQSHASLTTNGDSGRENDPRKRVDMAQAWGSPIKERAPRKLGGGERNE